MFACNIKENRGWVIFAFWQGDSDAVWGLERYSFSLLVKRLKSEAEHVTQRFLEAGWTAGKRCLLRVRERRHTQQPQREKDSAKQRGSESWNSSLCLGAGSFKAS